MLLQIPPMSSVMCMLSEQATRHVTAAKEVPE